MSLEDQINAIKNNDIEMEEREKLLEKILLSCITEEEEVGLNHIKSLMNIGFPANLHLICALTALYWGTNGLSYLADAALNADPFQTRRIPSTVLKVLSHAASSSIEYLQFRFMYGIYSFPLLREILNLTHERYHSNTFTHAAWRALIDIAANLNQAGPTPTDLVWVLADLSTRTRPEQEEGQTKAFNSLFAACGTRWLRMNRKELNNYKSLLQEPHISEQEVHKYIADNPYLLDPFYAHVWSKPPLGEKLIADFVVRLMDDSYIVVEIEKPSDQIMTKKGDLSAKTIHAIRQADEYLDWLDSNRLYAQQNFENLRRPSGLVVIGMEENLDPKQKQLLVRRNEDPNVKIVGFDWLHQRAEAILNNLAKHGFERFEP